MTTANKNTLKLIAISVVIILGIILIFSQVTKAANVHAFQEGTWILFELDGEGVIYKDGIEIKPECGQLKDINPKNGSNEYQLLDLDLRVMKTFYVVFDKSLMGDIVYPNPFVNYINVKKKVDEVVVIKGQNYILTSLDTNLNLSGLPSGMYIVEVQTPNGITKRCQKIIKQ